jgi:dTDP-4-dehydrorhamnose reductase
MAAGAAARAVLVIGAHGVLGTALVRAFEEASWRVVQGVRQSDGARGSIVADLDRPEAVAVAIAGVDLVVDPVPHPGLTAERVVRRFAARISASDGTRTRDLRRDRPAL